jgi:hypothetical protein
MLEAAGDLFDRHAEGGRVRLLYDVRVYVGRL